MKGTEAAEIINTLSYRPGWTFEALALPEHLRGRVPKSMRDAVMYRWTSATVNTNREDALNGYPEEITLSDVEPLDARDFADRDALLFHLFGRLMEHELHESREFFRVGGDKQAPFHPHRPEGIDLWEKCVALDTETN